MTLALAGYGYVGRAVYHHLARTQGIAIIDPRHGDTRVCDVEDLDGLIICVPTPQALDGSCDVHHVVEVLDDTPEDVPVLVKSTVSLDAWRFLEGTFPRHVLTYCPEFLRAATAEQDVAETSHIILGGGNIGFWIERYARHFDAKLTVLSAREAIAVKYFRNSFLAAKVSFFNQVADFCAGAGLDFEVVRSGIASDKRIGASHTYLNEQGKRGWGGACFPKDTQALLHMAALRGIDLPVLDAAVRYNDKVTHGTTEARPSDRGNDCQTAGAGRVAD